MTATLERPHPPESPSMQDSSPTKQADQLPDASVLEDKTPDWMRLPAVSAVYVLILGAVLLVFANRPLWHTDLWDHINYGQHILQTGALPDTEPLLPLAAGMPMVNPAWLSQIGLAGLFSQAGIAGIQFAYGLTVVLAVAVIMVAATYRSGSTVFGLLGGGIFLWMNLQQFLAVRPQLIGVLCFAGLISILMSGGPRHRSSWWALPLLFAVWANCHGSWSMGLLAMAVTGIGHGFSVLARTRSLKAVLCNRRIIRLVLLTQLCSAAVLLNPYGLDLYYAVVNVGRHPNIATMFEWDALTLRMKQGQVAAVLVCVLIVVLKLSPRRLRGDEALLLLVTGGMALWSSRMINWWAPVMALAIATHAAAAWRALANRRRRSAARPRGGLWTLVNVGLCWVFFALTTLGIQVVHGKTPVPERALSRQTPLGTIQFLNGTPELPPGPVFVPAEWAGALTQFGPAELQPMVNLHVHVIPEEVWTDYLRLLSGPSDWNGLLDRYGINLVILEQNRSARLIKLIRDSGDWESLYEDAQAVVFRRQQLLN